MKRITVRLALAAGLLSLGWASVRTQRTQPDLNRRRCATGCDQHHFCARIRVAESKHRRFRPDAMMRFAGRRTMLSVAVWRRT